MPNPISRRLFLAHASTAAASALLFGCGLGPLVEERGPRGAILYASRYGATRENAGWIAEGMGRPAELLDVEQLTDETPLAKYDWLVIGSGIWVGGPHAGLIALLGRHAEALDGRIIGSFVVCGSRNDSADGRKRIERYLGQLHAPLKQPPPLSRGLGGRLVVDQLSEKDRAALERFYRNFLNRELKDWDRMDRTQAVDFTQTLLNARDYS